MLNGGEDRVRCGREYMRCNGCRTLQFVVGSEVCDTNSMVRSIVDVPDSNESIRYSK